MLNVALELLQVRVKLLELLCDLCHSIFVVDDIAVGSVVDYFWGASATALNSRLLRLGCIVVPLTGVVDR